MSNDRWYVLNNFGVATLCDDERDARKLAARDDKGYPHCAPHVATRMRAWSGKPPCGRCCEAVAFHVEIRRLWSLLNDVLPIVEWAANVGGGVNPEGESWRDKLAGRVRAAIIDGVSHD